MSFLKPQPSHHIKRFVVIPLIVGVLLFISVWGILWLASVNTYRVSFGVSFSPGYASYLGLDWKQTYQSILTDLRPKFIRLAIPWTEVEAKKGTFNFDDADYLINEAAKHNVKVTLVLGQKVPRWPECFIPPWAKLEDKEDRQAAVLNYVTQVVNRYKNNDALQFWQVENEAFIGFEFGECQIFDKWFFCLTCEVL